MAKQKAGYPVETVERFGAQRELVRTRRGEALGHRAACVRSRRNTPEARIFSGLERQRQEKMSSILDQIKSNAVPAGVMRTAAKGALPLPPAEMLQVMVYLTHNPLFGQEAKMTLAAWDLEATRKVVADPAAPPEVIGYYWMETNRRPALMPALIENPAISEILLMEAAAGGSRELVELLLASPRARSSPAVAEAMAENPSLTPQELEELRAASIVAPAPEASATESLATTQEDEEAEAAHQAWYQKYSSEIAAEEGKAYAPVGGEEEESQAEPQPEAGVAAAADASASLVAAALGSAAKAAREDEKKLSVLQRIAKMNASERVKTAFMGGRDERLILIRDGAKVVQNAVLASPKLTDPEVEGIAAARNVHENVLREIARNRRFMKNYNVGRNLVNNPKCPLDVSLTLVRNLMVFDLKTLRFSKGVPETLRKVAAQLYREKTGPAKEIKRKT